MIFAHTIKPVILSADPVGSASGEFYYNHATGKWRGYSGSSWIDINSPSATISSSAITSTISSSALLAASALVAIGGGIVASAEYSIVSASVDWSGVSNKPNLIASATFAASVDWAGISSKPFSIASANVAASVDWSGVSNQPSNIASATISSSAVISASTTSIDWSNVQSKPSIIASATISASTTSIDWNDVQNKPSTIASATISSSAIVSASVDWSGVTSKPSTIASATVSSSAIISSSADWNGISNKPSTIASATISASTTSIDWSNVENKPTSIASATISSSAIISSSATISAHSNTASAIDWSGVTSKPDPVLTVSLSGDISGTASTVFTDLGNANMTINAAILSASTMNVDHIDFSTTASSTASIARLQWTSGEGTLAFGLSGGNVNLNIGQEEVALCYNGTGSALTAGTVVYINGAQGQRPSIAKASNSGEGTSSKVLGLVSETIANGAEGFITTFGILRNVDTSLYAPGTALWLSSSAGLFTSTKSYAPNHLVFIGYSIKQSSTAGQIFVTPQNGYELYELHNVSASNPNNNDILYYNTSASLWQTASVQSLITNLVNMDYIDFDITPTATNAVGRMIWDSTAGTVAVTMDNGPTLTTALIGQGQFIKATNKDTVNMVKGDVVYISGAIGNRVAIKLASASVNGLEQSPIGMCTENISTNSAGFVIISGTISGINTQAYTEGDAVWLSASPGKITNTRPEAPLRGTVIGHVINSNIATGTINVHVVEGQKLSFLSDVVLTASTLAGDNVLAYNATSTYWENTSIQNKITTASVGFANVSASSTTSTSANVSASVDWSGVTNKPSTIASATISASTTSIDWNDVQNKPSIIASATISASTMSIDWSNVQSKPTSIASATISSSAITSSSADISASVDWMGVTSKPLTIASATISASTTSIDWSGVVNKPLTIASATVSSSSDTTASFGGQNPSYYAADSSVVHLAGSENITGSKTFNQVDLTINGNFGSNTASTLAQMSGRLRFDSDFSDIARGPNKVETYNDGFYWIGGLGVHADAVAYYSGGSHRWYKSASQNVYSEFMSLDSSGRLGIGTTSPASALHVVGAALITTNLNVNGSITGTLSGNSSSATISSSALVANNSASLGSYQALDYSRLAADNTWTGQNIFSGYPIMFGKTLTNGSAVTGASVSTYYGVEIVEDSVSKILRIDRQSNNGNLLIFTRGGNEVGQIKVVAGGTVGINSLTETQLQLGGTTKLLINNVGMHLGDEATSVTSSIAVGSYFADGASANLTILRRNSFTATAPVLALSKFDTALNVTASTAQRIQSFYLNGTLNGFINVATGIAPVFAGTSDYRLKENIQDFTGSIDIIKEIKVRSFNWKKDKQFNAVGFIAHELAEVLPIAVDGEKDAIDKNGDPEYQHVMDARLIPYLTGALKDTILKVETLEKTIVQLQDKIQQLESK